MALIFWIHLKVWSGDLSEIAMNALRKSVIAGSWYPGAPSILRRDIENYFDLVPDLELEGEVVGLIAPHAGYTYSGQVAANVYKLIRGKKYDAVIVVGPSHRVAFHGVSIFSKGAYETPLGIVPVAEELAEKIKILSKTVVDNSRGAFSGTFRRNSTSLFTGCPGRFFIYSFGYGRSECKYLSGTC